MKITKALFFIILLLLAVHISKSISLTCEAGGPYAPESSVIVTGNVTDSASAVMVMNISKIGTLKAEKTTTSDASGFYYFIVSSLSEGLDYGTYTVHVNATDAGNTANCSDTFEIQMPQNIDTCDIKTLVISGKAVYSTGSTVTSGNIFVSIDGTDIKNSTSFTSGSFSIALKGCMYVANRYTMNIVISDNAGKSGSSQIIFSPT